MKAVLDQQAASMTAMILLPEGSLNERPCLRDHAYQRFERVTTHPVAVVPQSAGVVTRRKQRAVGCPAYHTATTLASVVGCGARNTTRLRVLRPW